VYILPKRTGLVFRIGSQSKILFIENEIIYRLIFPQILLSTAFERNIAHRPPIAPASISPRKKIRTYYLPLGDRV